MGRISPGIVSRAGIDQASAGNPALRSMLQQLTTAANTQATKTSISGKSAPNQSTATVSFQNPYYTVTFTDPGGATAGSPAQAAQQAAAATLGANPVQSVVYHQVEAATSILFDAANSLHSYGGDTGSLQTQFTIGDLDAKRQWYFRIRTSFDGRAWNQWKTLNNKALSANPSAVVRTGIGGGYFAAMTLPGKQTVGFGIGQVPSGEIVQAASGVLIENLLGLAGAGTVNDVGQQAIGIAASAIAANGVTTLKYRAADPTTTPWSGNLNFLTFGWAAGNQKLTETVQPDGGRWIVMTVSGGTRWTIGVGRSSPGQAISYPAGFTAANSMGVCTPASVQPPNGHDAHGILQSSVVIANGQAVPTVLYGDGSGNSWPGDANWFVVAWESALQTKVVPVRGGQYLLLPTGSGAVAIGKGTLASGSVMPLPVGGYGYQNCVAFSCLNGYDDIGLYMHGVAVCTIDVGLQESVGTVYGLYTNGQKQWTGNTDWFSVAWL